MVARLDAETSDFDQVQGLGYVGHCVRDGRRVFVAPRFTTLGRRLFRSIRTTDNNLCVIITIEQRKLIRSYTTDNNLVAFIAIKQRKLIRSMYQ